jgi:hypothetical protein
LTFPDVLQSTAETVGFAVVGFAVVGLLRLKKELKKLEKKPLVFMLGFFKPEFTKSINSWVVYNSKQLKKVSKK